MTVFKCKMCGGTLEINNETVFTCEYCGTRQTLPKLDDEKRSQMYDRANHFRRNNEFDKAMGIYEQILNEDSTDAEAYWSLVLCRYGIEYVEDPASHKRIPTVNRAQFTSIFDDDNYKSALRYADGFQKSLYEEEANAINEIQKGILAISQKEEPFDVFICYKETDASGRRTPDSVLANELYYQLTEEGFKVFFARITLEDKLGSAYEPYIFAALNSAKVMVVLGTKQEHFNAVWVKNEWSRYLALIKNGAGKMLIPAYRDMDPYDLPEEFSHLQAQDMSKLGFMQDLIRGIKKIVGGDKPTKTIVKETVVSAESAGANVDSLLERAFIFLDDRDWESADEYCEKVLDIDPKCAEAYLGKLMVEFHVRKRERIKDLTEFFEGSKNYEKAIRYGDEKLKAELEGYLEFAMNREYQKALAAMNSAKTEEDFKNAEKLFSNVDGNYKDSKQLRQKCLEQAEEMRKLEAYNMALEAFESAVAVEQYQEAEELFKNLEGYKDSVTLAEKCVIEADALRKDAILSMAKEDMSFKNEVGYTSAIRQLEAIPGWKDADELKEICLQKIEELKNETKRTFKLVFIIIAVICAVIVMANLILNVMIPNIKYNQAVKLMESAKYEEAISAFEAMNGYKDSSEKIVECKYNEASKLMNEDKWKEAITTFESLNGYKDSYAKVEKCKNNLNDNNYNEAIKLLKEGKTKEAIAILKENPNHKDAFSIIKNYYNEYDKRISCGFAHAVGLNADGTVVATGNNKFGQCDVSNWSTITALATGNNHTVGLKADGSVIATGVNDQGQCNVSGWTNIVAVSAGSWHTVGLKAVGTVVATGHNLFGQCNVSGWTNIVAVSAGQGHTVGLKADGTVVAIGDTYAGTCDVEGWEEIVAVSAAEYCTIGLKADGTVVAKGNQTVSGWTNIVAVSAGDDLIVGLKADGTVIAVGEKCNVGEWTDIVAIAAGEDFAVGLRANGTVVSTKYSVNKWKLF